MRIPSGVRFFCSAVSGRKETYMKAGIIGGGRVGTCLAGYLKKAGMLAGITASAPEHSRSLAKQFGTQYMTNDGLVAAADVVLLTVPDRSIGSVAASLDGALAVGKTVLHCSGSLGLEPLAPLQAAGAHTGSLHPLQSFAGGATNLQGVYMAVDGDAEALQAAEKLAHVFGGCSFRVPAEERAAYHAAACICSNYAVAVEALAQKLMSRWMPGRDAAAAWKALLPLFEGTAANLRRTDNAGSVLTGPIARGDLSTVEKHLAVLPEEFLPAYRSLGIAAAQLALANGTIDAITARQLEKLLQDSEV